MAARLATCRDGGASPGRLSVGGGGRVACCGGLVCDCSVFPHSHGIINGGDILASPILSLASYDAGVAGQIEIIRPDTEQTFRDFMFYDAPAVGQGPSQLSCGSILWPRRILHADQTIFNTSTDTTLFSAEYVAIESFSVTVVPSGGMSVVCKDIYPSSQMLVFRLTGRMIHGFGFRFFDTQGRPIDGSTQYDRRLQMVAIMQADGGLAVSDSTTDGDVTPSCTSTETLTRVFNRTVFEEGNPNPLNDVIDITETVRGADVDQEVFSGPNQYRLIMRSTLQPRFGSGGLAPSGHDFRVLVEINKDVIRMCEDVEVETPITIPIGGGGTDPGTPVPTDGSGGDIGRPGDTGGGGGGGGGGPGSGSGTDIPGGPEVLPGGPGGPGGLPGGIDCASASCAEIRAEAERLFGDPSLVLFVCPNRPDCAGGGPLGSTTPDGEPDEPGPLPTDAPTGLPGGIPASQVQGSNFNCRGCGDG